MASRRGIWASLSFLALALAGCAASKPVSSQPAAAAAASVQEASGDWASFQVAPGYVLVNNVWNKTAAEGPYKQTIFQDGKAFGWTWQWPAAHGPVVSYPEVIFGDKPWDAPRPPIAGLPYHPGERKMIVDYDISLEAKGIYNLAFEYWPTTSVPAAKENIAGEVMVWVASEGLLPAGHQVGTLEVSGTTFDIWVNQDHSDASGANANRWVYVAFSAQKPMLKGPLDFGAFDAYLVEKGLFTKDQWISGLELGNEIRTGTGKTTIRNYKVTVK